MEATDTKAQTIATYNGSPEEFARRFDAVPARIDDIDETLACSEYEYPAVLEIGCGNGRDAEAIIQRTDEYLGIDASSGLIKIAQARIPRARFEVVDVEGFVFPSGIDVIFAFASLIHIDRFGLFYVFEKMHECLNEFGIVRISIKKSDSYQEVTTDDGVGPRTYYHYSERDIRDLAASPPFEIIKLETVVLRDQEWLEVIMRKA